MPSRGYPELTSRLNEFLTDFNSRAITGDPKDAGMLNAMNMTPSVREGQTADRSVTGRRAVS